MTEAAWLTGFVWCEECQQKVWHQNSGRQAALRYYRCSGINKRICRAPMARAETLEAEMLTILGLLTIPPDLAAAVVTAARQFQSAPEVIPLPPERGVEQKLMQLQQAYEAEILTRTEYERKRKALLARAQTPALPGAVNEARALSLLTDVRALVAAVQPAERRTVVSALFEKVWMQQKGIVALTPRADVGPILAGLAQARYGCLYGVPLDRQIDDDRLLRVGRARGDDCRSVLELEAQAARGLAAPIRLLAARAIYRAVVQEGDLATYLRVGSQDLGEVELAVHCELRLQAGLDFQLHSDDLACNLGCAICRPDGIEVELAQANQRFVHARQRQRAGE